MEDLTYFGSLGHDTRLSLGPWGFISQQSHRRWQARGKGLKLSSGPLAWVRAARKWGASARGKFRLTRQVSTRRLTPAGRHHRDGPLANPFSMFQAELVLPCLVCSLPPSPPWWWHLLPYLGLQADPSCHLWPDLCKHTVPRLLSSACPMPPLSLHSAPSPLPGLLFPDQHCPIQT